MALRPDGMRGSAFGLAVAGALLAWVPGLGLLLSLAGLALALRAGGARWSVAMAIFGLLLGGGLTGLFLLAPRGGESPEERQIRERFERRFEPEPPDGADGGEGGAGGA